jgi:hypothetical protein
MLRIQTIDLRNVDCRDVGKYVRIQEMVCKELQMMDPAILSRYTLKET